MRVRVGSKATRPVVAAALAFMIASTTMATTAGGDQEQYLKGTNNVERDVTKAVDYLNNALELEDLPQVVTALGDIYMFGDGVDRNLTRAFEYFSQGASKGWPAAQFKVGMMYASGLGVARDEGRALLYYHFAGLGGDWMANMALGYRHHYEVGVKANCEVAALHYSKVAEKAVQDLDGQYLLLYHDRHRLDEFEDTTNEIQDFIHMKELFADNGDVESLMFLGFVYANGLESIPRDYSKSFEMYSQALELGEQAALPPLGHLYLHGHGVDRDVDHAYQLFKTAADQGVAGGDNGVGYCLMHGLGVKRDVDSAVEHLKLAANENDPDGAYNLGVVYSTGVGKTKKDYAQATNMFIRASRHHALAPYNLGVMAEAGIGSSKSCGSAVKHFKHVAERHHLIESYFQNAFRAFVNDDVAGAVVYYQLLSELGLELASYNLGWLYRELTIGDFDGLGMDDVNDIQWRSLYYTTRSADQGNTEADMIIGDAYFYGIGTDVDYQIAAAYYLDTAKSNFAQAKFNFAYMHQWGLGVSQDFHLAKRYYDEAAEVDPEAIIPATIALQGLYVHQFVAAQCPWVLHHLGLSVGEGENDASGEMSAEAEMVVSVFLTVMFIVLSYLRFRASQQEALEQRRRVDAAEEAAAALASQIDGTTGGISPVVSPVLQPSPSTSEVVPSYILEEQSGDDGPISPEVDNSNTSNGADTVGDSPVGSNS